MATTNRAREAAGLPPAEPGKEVSRIEREQARRIDAVQKMVTRFAKALRNDKDAADRFVIDSITALRTTPKLALCTELSFLGSLMTAAQLSLRPNLAALGHCWVLPFENKRNGTYEAQFILGYRGMITVAGRSGVGVNAHTIYDGEEYEVRYGLDERLHHVPILDGELRPPLAHYAICRSTTGGIAWRVIPHSEALAARDASPGFRFGGPDNPWRRDEENHWPMCRKTAVRRTFPYVPTDSPDLAMAFAADDRVINLVDDQPVVQDDALTVVRLDETEPVEPSPPEPGGAPVPPHPDEPAEPPVARTAPARGKSRGTKQRPRAGRPGTALVDEKPKVTDAPATGAGAAEPTPEDIAAMNEEARRERAEWEKGQP
jgi:recombination protein RecT